MPPHANRRARGDRTRALLVAAGMELFGRQGVEATSVDEITAAAQVAKGTFYVHFEHKTDVLLERAALLIQSLVEAESDDDAVAALADLGRRVATEMSAMPRPVMGRMTREIVGHREAWLRVLGDRPTLNAIILPIIERGQTQGAFRTDLSARRLAQAVTVLWLDAVVGWAERPRELDLGEDLRRATSLLLDGAVS